MVVPRIATLMSQKVGDIALEAEMGYSVLVRNRALPTVTPHLKMYCDSHGDTRRGSWGSLHSSPHLNPSGGYLLALPISTAASLFDGFHPRSQNGEPFGYVA